MNKNKNKIGEHCMTSAAYLEPVQIVALCADVGDDAGGQNEELHHLQGLRFNSASRYLGWIDQCVTPQVVRISD